MRRIILLAVVLVGCGQPRPLLDKIITPKGTSVTVNVYTCPAPASTPPH
jgi:hypothetical protein